MRYQARENKDFQGVWIVEAVDLADGDSPRSILFHGFEARAQAEAYAAEKNPALSRDAGKTDLKLADWRKTHQHEVGKVEGLIKDMTELDPEDASLLTKLKAVYARLERHIREEEQEIFPRISKVWNETKLKQAGTDMKEMKAKKLKLTTVR